MYTFAQIGYDDINGEWYASNEQQRRVFHQDPNDGTWGIAFMVVLVMLGLPFFA